MTRKSDKLRKIIEFIDTIAEEAFELEKQYKEELSKVHPNFALSARNLIHYRALRKHDLRNLQKSLGDLGLSRFAKAESHVLASLCASRKIIKNMLNEKPKVKKRAPFTIKQGRKRMNSTTRDLLGYRSKGRRTRIMVTFPTDAAEDYHMVHQMLETGMNAVRINCAHDGLETWLKMINNAQEASRRQHNKMKITMDLGGPKIRTGSISPGPEILRIRPEKDELGRIKIPLRIWMGPDPHEERDMLHIPVTKEIIEMVEPGQTFYLSDTRDKHRQFHVVVKEPGGCIISCAQPSYLISGMPVYADAELQNPAFTIGHIPAREQFISLHPGDPLYIHADPAPGMPAVYAKDGKLESAAHISCTSPEVFKFVNPGEPVQFDDGKIGGYIESVEPDEMLLKITRTREGGGKLKADKGMNFPQSKLGGIQGLTEKDRRDIEFVAAHADVVNMSFVNTPDDVNDLLSEIRKYQDPVELGIILKIETRQAFENLTEILLAGMQTYPMGVMVARGDLAIECGWQNMARIQEEILSLCRAAHVPDILATQVLENLAKKGLPSRAEITDAAMAQRSECVMMNKGPSIIRAIRLLDRILKDREAFMEKNAPLLPALKIEVN